TVHRYPKKATRPAPAAPTQPYDAAGPKPQPGSPVTADEGPRSACRDHPGPPSRDDVPPVRHETWVPGPAPAQRAPGGRSFGPRGERPQSDGGGGCGKLVQAGVLLAMGSCLITASLTG